MKRRNAIQIGELIRQAIEDSGSTNTYNSQNICYLWPEAVGPTINRYTTERWIHHDELHVRIASSSIKNELSFLTDAILQRLNELAGTTANPVIRRLIIH